MKRIVLIFMGVLLPAAGFNPTVNDVVAQKRRVQPWEKFRRVSPLNQLRYSGVTVTKLDGGQQHLGEVLGFDQPVVIQLWSAACEQSRAAVPQMKEIWRKYREAGLVLIALNVQDATKDAAAVREFVRAQKIDYPVYFASAELSQFMASGLTGTPQTYLFTRTGEIGQRLIGWEPQRGVPALERALAELTAQ